MGIELHVVGVVVALGQLEVAESAGEIAGAENAAGAAETVVGHTAAKSD